VTATTDDIVALDQLQNKYVTLLDARRFDELLDLFVDDVVVDISGVTGEVWRGKADAYANYVSHANPQGSAHLTMNGVVDVDGDTATGTRYLLSARWSLDPGADGVLFGTLGTYKFSFVKIDGTWLINRIVIRSVFGERGNVFVNPVNVGVPEE
jgi:hypothetical protein